ncbi:MAG TPA: hypothetical protein DCM71_13995 [Runella sp.]|nr:hypothetical protein [Runella sp.]
MDMIFQNWGENTNFSFRVLYICLIENYKEKGLLYCNGTILAYNNVTDLRFMRLFKRTGVLLFLGVIAWMNTWAQTPTITTTDVSGAAACAGATFSVAFTPSNVPTPAKRTYTVQLSGTGGTFTSPTALASGATSPIVVTLPATAPNGEYRLRVVSDTTGITSVPTSIFTMLRRPTATLSGDTTITLGGTATLTVVFTGNGPWTYTFTNTNTGTTLTSPLKGIVQPTVSTTYALQSVSNVCGAGTVAGSARVRVLPIITPTFASTSVCAGSTATVAFVTTGTFESTAAVTYTAQVSDSTGSFTNPVAIGTGTASPLQVTFPASLLAGKNYKVRVIASASATSVGSGVFAVQALPTATLSGSTTIGVGESAKLTLDFTGEGPWTYVLSNDQTATVNTTPALVTVSPTTTTTYSVKSVRNACGTAPTPTSTVQVKVNPRVSAADVALGSVCVGSVISLPFVVTGTFEGAVTYTVQLSDATGSFTAPRALATGTSSPISTTIPANVAAGAAYRLRVVASVTSISVNSASFIIKVRPTAVLSGAASVNFGESTTLPVTLTGDGPWSLALSDGTTATSEVTPAQVIVKPTQTTVYQLTSVRNSCGEGTVSGIASVTVIPRVITENITSGICSGKEFEVKFSLGGGTLPANTVFQSQLSDSLGNFTNAVIIGTGSRSPILANIPAIPNANGYRIRVVVVGSTAVTSQPTSPFLLGRRPTAALSGGVATPLKPGDELLLVVQFTGDAPWTYTMSDNTTGTTNETPVLVTVKPTLPTTYTLSSVSNSCGTGTVSGSVTANVVITGVEEEQEKIIVGPNPLTERLRLNIDIPTATEWQLIDAQGRLYQKRQWTAGEYRDEINTQTLPTGLYFLRIKVGDKWLERKLLKQ